MSAALSTTSRRWAAVVGQKRPYTSLGGRFECSGRGHGRIQPFLHWSETATTHATSSLWCDVVRGRSTERESASHGAGPTHRVERIESTNQIGSHGRVHLSILQSYSNLLNAAKWPFLFLLWPNGHSYSFCGLAAIPFLGYLSTIAFPTNRLRS